MNATQAVGDAPHMDRVLELLADRASQGLSEAEARELDRLLVSADGLDPESMDLAAAAAYLAIAGPMVEPMPASLRSRIEHDAATRLRFGAADRTPGRQAGLEAPSPVLTRPAPGRFNNSERPAADRPSRARRRPPAWVGYSGWAAAAAMLLVSAAAWWPAISGSITPASPAAERERLLADAGPRVITAGWVNPADQTPQPGDVVWDNERQQGYMRLASLPVNDPSVEQYQLWIIDPTHEHPIDGGVFNITQSCEVVVPIDAKLRVTEPAAFAVTVEKPGGVVVSSRERLPLLAMVKK